MLICNSYITANHIIGKRALHRYRQPVQACVEYVTKAGGGPSSKGLSAPTNQRRPGYDSQLSGRRVPPVSQEKRAHEIPFLAWSQFILGDFPP